MLRNVTQFIDLLKPFDESFIDNVSYVLYVDAWIAKIDQNEWSDGTAVDYRNCKSFNISEKLFSIKNIHSVCMCIRCSKKRTFRVLAEKI
jgi:hypothetical protein